MGPTFGLGSVSSTVPESQLSGEQRHPYHRRLWHAGGVDSSRWCAQRVNAARFSPLPQAAGAAAKKAAAPVAEKLVAAPAAAAAASKAAPGAAAGQKVRAQVLGSWGNTMRDTVRNKER